MTADDRVFMLGEDIGVYGGAFGVCGRPAGPFRAEPDPRHPDLRARHRRRSGRRRPRRHASDRGDPVLRLHLPGDGPDRQPGREDPLHARRSGRRSPWCCERRCGSGTGAAAQHSQSLEAWFAHVPGLKVVMPSCAEEVKGLLLAAIDDPNPVMFLEHKLLYKTSGPVPEGSDRIPLGSERRATHRRRPDHRGHRHHGVALPRGGRVTRRGRHRRLRDRPPHALSSRRPADPRRRVPHRPCPAGPGGTRAMSGSWPRSPRASFESPALYRLLAPGLAA